MKKVLLRGPILSKSGYGEHCRQVFTYLMSRNDIDLKVQLLPWGITPWYLKKSDLNGLVGKVIEKSNLTENEKFDVSIQVQLPNEWDTSLAKKNVGITAAVETDRANPMWTLTHVNKMDAVIVPSKHAKNSLTSAAIPSTDIHVVPEAYFEELLDPGNIELDFETKFNFLTVGVLTGFKANTDRKNLLYLLKWFVETFKDNKEVGLVVKTNRGRETTIDRKGTEILLSQVLKEVGHKEFPKIYLLHGSMSRKEMSSLYHHDDIKGFISLTRGEGFGLPHLEASVAKLPVIATNWSAHKEFLDLGKWIKLDYDLLEIDQEKIDNNIFMQGSKWAFVKEQDFKKKIQNFYKKPEKPKEWACQLSDKLTKEYSQKSINEKYEEVLGDFLS